MQSNLKITLYVLQLTVVFGAALALLNNVLGPVVDQNRKEARLTSILRSVPGWNAQEAQGSIESFFKQTVKTTLVSDDASQVYEASEGYAADAELITKLNGRGTNYKALFEVDPAVEEKIGDEKQRLNPIFTYEDKAKGEQLYIVAVRGNGLWDKIWAYVALDKSLTVKGVYFDHKAETPGLGAEIKDSEAFKSQFAGKKIYAGSEMMSITVKKKAPKGDHQVQGISGATVTSNGVSAMFIDGMAKYKAYFAKLKQEGKLSI